MKAAAELDYRVNHVARALNKQRSDLVGIIASGMENPYRASQVDAFAKELVSRGLRPMLFCIDAGDDTEQLIAILLDYSVSGVIVTSERPPESICEECLRRNIPLVVIDRGDDHAKADQVACDNEQGGKLAADTLLDSGCTDLFFLRPKTIVYAISRRLDGFTAAAMARNVAAFPVPIEAYDYASGRDVAGEVSRLSTVRSGVFCPNDLVAIGLLDALRGRYRRDVPAEVSLIGYDDIPQAAWDFVNLTTIRQSVQEIVSETVDLLQARIDAPDMPSRKVRLPVQLIRRGTT